LQEIVNSTNHDELLKLVNSKLGTQILQSSLSLGDPVIRIKRDNILDFFRILKLDVELSFNLFLSVTCVDWLDQEGKDERFEMVYHLLSTAKQYRLRIKVWVPESQPEIDSLVSIWSGANFMEREVWDMYGIKFKGHPDLRKILMYEEFKGHPLRKDYPVQGKQPRVNLRYPEVENTARHMLRSELVQIKKKPKVQDGVLAKGAAHGEAGSR